MGDFLKKVKSGDPLKLPAPAYNAFVDCANDYLRRRQNQIGEGSRAFTQTGIVLIKNNSGSARNRFDVLCISGVVITPTDNAEEFKNRVALVGVTPTASYAGKFAVLLEPIKAGKLGMACIDGVCAVQVNVVKTTHKYADIVSAQSGYLVSKERGAAAILYAEGVGTKWAVVHLGAGPATSSSMFAVTVTQTSGSGGSSSTTCDFKYTVKGLLGDELGTEKSPQTARISKTEYETPTADSPGTAYYDASGALQLYSVAQERPKSVGTILSAVSYPAILVCDATSGIRWLEMNANYKGAFRDGGLMAATYPRMHP